MAKRKKFYVYRFSTWVRGMACWDFQVKADPPTAEVPCVAGPFPFRQLAKDAARRLRMLNEMLTE